MFLPCPAIDQNIIKEHQHKFLKLMVEYLVHSGLKSGWCISQTERHDYKLEVPTMTSESSFLNILLSNSDLVIA